VGTLGSEDMYFLDRCLIEGRLSSAPYSGRMMFLDSTRVGRYCMGWPSTRTGSIGLHVEASQQPRIDHRQFSALCSC
jgi:hypothetical protein